MSGGWERNGRFFEHINGKGGSKFRMSVWTPENFEQLLDLPLGTEVILFTLMGGVALGGTCLVVDEKMREQTRKYIEEGKELNCDFAVYLLPENVVPDLAPEPAGPSGDQTGD